MYWLIEWIIHSINQYMRFNVMFVIMLPIIIIFFDAAIELDEVSNFFKLAVDYIRHCACYDHYVQMFCRGWRQAIYDILLLYYLNWS